MDYIREKYWSAVSAAEPLVQDGVVTAVATDMVLIPWIFELESFSGVTKCEVLAYLSMALHGAQDFYTHSNWGDTVDDTEAPSLSNPPGLGETDIAPFLGFT